MKHPRLSVLVLSALCAFPMAARTARAQEAVEVAPTQPAATVESDAPVAETPSAWLVEL